MGMLSEAPIFIDDTPIINSMEIRTKARRLQSEHGLGLIVIDYLQLMQGAKSNSDSRVQEVSEISRNLKGLARELNVPVLALSQLSRAVEHRDNKRPMLADLRESGSIEQDADVVMFIYRDDYYDKETENQNIAEVLIRKHRNGPTGDVQLFWKPEYMRFGTLDKKMTSSE
jgi:replicative DNA helicase